MSTASTTAPLQQKMMISLSGMLLAEPFLLKLLYARLLRDVSTAVTYRVTPWSIRSTPALAQVPYTTLRPYDAVLLSADVHFWLCEAASRL
jgi:hypothetical protein